MTHTIPRWVWLVLALVAGTLIGWLVIGWGLWPVTYRNMLPTDLDAAQREDYLLLAASSYAASQDMEALQRRVAAWAPADLQRDLAMLSDKLAGQEPNRAAAVGSLASLMQAYSDPQSPGSSVSGTTTGATITQSSQVKDISQTDNFLVLGTDTRPELEAWRTDSMMVVAIDHDSGRIGVVSIPRDLYVSIPGHGNDRINAVDYIGTKAGYPGGGAALVQRVVEEELGIPTQHYVRFRQNALTSLVDALGGVTVTLDCPLYEQAPDPRSPNGYDEFSLPAGNVLLDGPKARKFATYRSLETDFGRIRRQQQLLWAIRNRVLEGNLLPRIPQLWNALSDTFTTDLSLTDVVRLARLGAELDPQHVHGMVLGPGLVADYVTPEGWWTLMITDREALKAKLGELFSSQPLSQLGRKGEGKECPPAPPGFPDLSSSPEAGG